MNNKENNSLSNNAKHEKKIVKHSIFVRNIKQHYQ